MLPILPYNVRHKDTAYVGPIPEPVIIKQRMSDIDKGIDDNKKKDTKVEVNSNKTKPKHTSDLWT